MKLTASWKSPEKRGRTKHEKNREEFLTTQVSSATLTRSLFLRILAHPNVRSKEDLVRQYDHEVQGKTLVKPYSGVEQDAPNDGGVIRPVFGSDRGLTITHGLCPRVGDDDTYKMAVLAVDEAFRAHIALGGDPGLASALDNFCWPDPVTSDENKDGEYKLAQLVRANKGLRDACLAYGLPLISGKDSMKNDARIGNKKISVRPTLLISLMGIIQDTKKVPSAGFTKAGDIIYLCGVPSSELGGSIVEHIALADGHTTLESGAFGPAPALNLSKSVLFYEKISEAISKTCISSIHDVSDGGLAVALAESCFHFRLGSDVSIIDLQESGKKRPAAWTLFSEGPAQFIVSVKPENEKVFNSILKGQPVQKIGFVINQPEISVRWIDWQTRKENTMMISLNDALDAWKPNWDQPGEQVLK